MQIFMLASQNERFRWICGICRSTTAGMLTRTQGSRTRTKDLSSRTDIKDICHGTITHIGNGGG